MGCEGKNGNPHRFTKMAMPIWLPPIFEHKKTDV
jgi:hypothetical protein